MQGTIIRFEAPIGMPKQAYALDYDCGDPRLVGEDGSELMGTFAHVKAVPALNVHASHPQQEGSNNHIAFAVKTVVDPASLTWPELAELRKRVEDAVRHELREAFMRHCTKKEAK